MFNKFTVLVNLYLTLGAGLLWPGSAVAATGANGEKLTHPIHGHQASPNIKYIYGPRAGRPADWNRGDLTFPDIGTYPDITDLTEEEKYIIAGSINSAWSNDRGLCDWVNSTQSLVSQFYEQYGYIPDKLDAKTIRSIDGMESVADKNLCQFLNPLTDEWPALKAANPSPGDVYIRPLTRDEIDFYAAKSKSYRKLWFDGQWKDPATGEQVPVMLDGKVYYMRIYGWKEVIYANLVFNMHQR